jgi:pyridoxamine 5'-phosphate oxidase family protein
VSFTVSELEYLAGQPLGRIATMRPDGTLQVSPVTFRYNPAAGSIDVSGYNLTASRKFKNIEANGKVAFVVDDLATVQPWRPRCVEIRGHAEALADVEGGPLIRIHPERIISFGIDEVDTPAHSLTVNARNVD